MENVMTTPKITVSSASERGINKYKETADAYEKIAKLSILIVVLSFLAIAVLAVQLARANTQSESLTDQIRNLQSTNASLREQLQDVNDELDNAYTEIEALEAKNKTLSNSISGFKETINELDSSNAKLIKDNKSLDKKLKKFELRSELYDKYEYAIYDKAKNRTDLTYSQIKTGEELMLEKGIDPDLLFGIIMTESNGNEKATSTISTARGYGQFLAGSGEYVYEHILHLGVYNHAMAYNGETNIRMAAAYLGYFKSRGYSAYDTVKAYRGLEPTDYIKTIDSYIGTKGKSFAQIAANW